MPLIVAGVTVLFAAADGYLAWRITQKTGSLGTLNAVREMWTEEIDTAKQLRALAVASRCDEKACIFEVPSGSVEASKTKGRTRIVLPR